MRYSLLCIFLAAALLVWPFATLPAEDPPTHKLNRVALDSSPAAVEAYLRSLFPTGDLEAKIQRLIAQLGSSDYEARRSAMSELLLMPIPPVKQLEDAAQSRDAEVRVRARRILVQVSHLGYKTKLVAVLNDVEQRQMKGLAEVVFQLMPQLREPYLFQFAERALQATVRIEDVDLVRGKIATAASPQREAAVLALRFALGKEALPELLPMLGHAEPSMRLAAAEALADLGIRESLPVLVELLESPQAMQRRRSVSILRAVTGQRFGFSAFSPEESREPAAKAWRNWLNEHGKTARLTFPFPRRPLEQGRTVVCIWASKIFKEVTKNKADVFTAGGFKYVWGCHATPDGRRLVADAEQHAVYAYDENGRETWRRINLPGRPTSVEGLDNGNVLVACSDSDRVVELAPDGRIVWEFKIEGRPTTAQRRPDGQTIINLQNAGRVVEVDPQGNVTDLVKGLDYTHTAQQLENGNVLVTEMRQNRVDEYNLKGNIVWSKTGLKNPAQAQRLSNGNTLIGDEEGLHEFDANNKRVWHLEVSRARFYRY